MARNQDEEKPDLGIPVEDPNITVDLTENDDEEPEELLEGGQPKGKEEPERTRDPVTGKWSGKKRERGQNKREETNWRTEKTALEAQMKRQQDDSDRRFRELQARVDQSMRQAPAAGVPTDPFANAIGDIQKQLAAELQLIEKDNARDYTRYMELQDKKNELIAERTWARKNAQQQAQPAPQQDAYAVRRTFLHSEHPWLQDPRMSDLANKAWAIRNNLVQVEGRPDTLETDREALSQALARFGGEFGLRVPAPPSQRTRQIYAAAPASQTGPYRGSEPQEIEIPRHMVNGSGLDERALRAALRSRE
jgi:hypothetical protein